MERVGLSVVVVVHEGRAGHLDVGGRRYLIEHVDGGRFVVHFPSGHRHRRRDADLAALEAFVALQPDRWAIEDRRRGRGTR